MNRLVRISLASVFLSVLSGISFTTQRYALARTEDEVSVPAGEIFTFTVDTSLPSPVFSWVLEQEGGILETQSQPFFRTVFPDPGRYDLSVSVQGESHRFVIQAEADAALHRIETGILRAILHTHPPADAGNILSLPAQGGVVKLVAEESTGNIARYAMDLNLREDTDADGVPQNDADNAFHPSLRTGEPWYVSVRPGEEERERIVRLQVISPTGETSDTHLTIRFDPNLRLTPRLSIFPAAQPMEGVVVLPPGGGVLRFNAEASLGGVRRFLLDLDALHDRDGDGVRENDDDAAHTLFMRDGSDLYVSLQPKEGERERRVFLMVFDDAGQSASLLRRITFGEATEGTAPLLKADQSTLRVRKSFTLEVQNPPEGAAHFRWDFQSDGRIDTETAVPSLLLEPDAPGILPVHVIMLDAANNELGTVTGEFTVLAAGTETVPPPAEGEGGALEIRTVVDNLTVSFEPAPARPLNLLRLQPNWSFGDGGTSYLLTPSHTYAQAGTYTVTLSLRDPESQKTIVGAETTVEVQGGAVSPPLSSEEENGRGTVLGAPVVLLSRTLKILSLLVLLLSFPVGIVLVIKLQARRRNVSEKKPPLPSPKSQPMALEVPVRPTSPASIQEEGEVLPPWLQGTPPSAATLAPPKPSVPPPAAFQTQSNTTSLKPPPLPSVAPQGAKEGPPRPAPSPPKPAPPPPGSPPSPVSASVPSWLQKGLGTQAQPSPPSVSSPPPLTPAAPKPPPAPLPPPLTPGKPLPTPARPPPSPLVPPQGEEEITDDETIAIIKAQMPDTQEKKGPISGTPPR